MIELPPQDEPKIGPPALAERLEISPELALRLPREHDTERVIELAIRNRDKGMQDWFDWIRTLKNVKGARRYISERLEGFKNRSFLAYFMEHREVIVGGISAKFDWEDKSASLGYWVDFPERNKGLATAALKRFSGYCFEDLGLQRLEMDVALDNAASIKVAEHVGFKDTNNHFNWPHSKKPIETARFELNLEDWQALSATN